MEVTIPGVKRVLVVLFDADPIDVSVPLVRESGSIPSSQPLNQYSSKAAPLPTTPSCTCCPHPQAVQLPSTWQVNFPHPLTTRLLERIHQRSHPSWIPSIRSLPETTFQKTLRIVIEWRVVVVLILMAIHHPWATSRVLWHCCIGDAKCGWIHEGEKEQWDIWYYDDDISCVMKQMLILGVKVCNAMYILLTHRIVHRSYVWLLEIRLSDS